jgi:hypothetical protein
MLQNFHSGHIGAVSSLFITCATHDLKTLLISYMHTGKRRQQCHFVRSRLTNEISIVVTKSKCDYLAILYFAYAVNGDQKAPLDQGQTPHSGRIVHV